MRVLIEMVNALGIKTAGAADNPINRDILF